MKNAWAFRLLAASALVLAAASGAPARADGLPAPFPEPPTPLPTPAGPGSGEPCLAVGADGSTFLSWFETLGKGHALKVARLDGSRWSSPTTVASGDSFLVNWANFPSLAVLGDQRLAIAWPWKHGGSAYACDVRIAQSRDGGRTWGRFTVPNRDRTATEHGFVSLVPEAGEVRAIWLDGRKFPAEKPDAHGHDQEPEGEMTLRTARITADGALADEAELDARVCDCCQTGAASADAGVLAVYRDRGEKEIRDISIVRREKQAWTSPAPVSADGWVIPGCPVNGPAVEARGAQVVVAWFTAAGERTGIRAAFSGDGGRSFGAAIDLPAGDPLGRVDAVLLEDGAALVSWVEAIGQEGEVHVARVTAAGEVGQVMTVARTSAARASGFPRMVRSGSRVIFAWTETGTRNQVRVAAASIP